MTNTANIKSLVLALMAGLLITAAAGLAIAPVLASV
jgi:hypothetical protein